MNITETSSKDEVITATCELVDQYEAVIKNLKQQQQVLFYDAFNLFLNNIHYRTNCFLSKVKIEGRNSKERFRLTYDCFGDFNFMD